METVSGFEKTEDSGKIFSSSGRDSGKLIKGKRTGVGLVSEAAGKGTKIGRELEIDGSLKVK